MKKPQLNPKHAALEGIKSAMMERMAHRLKPQTPSMPAAPTPEGMQAPEHMQAPGHAEQAVDPMQGLGSAPKSHGDLSDEDREALVSHYSKMGGKF